MDSTTSSNSSDSFSRGSSRGRGRSRGGLGKYLRARGRGHRRGGRPAEFRERLVLEGEQDDDDEEEAAMLAQKYSRRQLGTNADRYKEPEPELDTDGEEIVEPEIDLGRFLERQRLEDTDTLKLEPTFAPKQDDDDVDRSLTQITSKPKSEVPSWKGKIQKIEWDESLEQMSREKAAAEAHRDIRDRLRASIVQQRDKPTRSNALRPTRKQGKIIEAPPLPIGRQEPEGEKEKMEGFLDGLLG